MGGAIFGETPCGELKKNTENILLSVSVLSTPSRLPSPSFRPVTCETAGAFGEGLPQR